MKLATKQIEQLRKCYKEAQKAQFIAENKAQNLAICITKMTGVDGHIDYFFDDGFGFTPESDNDTHISIEDIISAAEKGRDITEEYILDNLLF